MANYSININWYNEIKGLGITANAEHITEGAFAGQVEVDILDEANAPISTGQIRDIDRIAA